MGNDTRKVTKTATNPQSQHPRQSPRAATATWLPLQKLDNSFRLALSQAIAKVFNRTALGLPVPLFDGLESGDMEPIRPIPPNLIDLPIGLLG